MRRVLPIFLGLITCSGCPAAPTAPPENLDELVAQQVGALVDSKLLIGAAVGIIANGETHTYYLGKTTKGDGPAPDANTLFEIGSITKVFTGTALAALHLDGALSLDDTVTNHLPEGTAVPDFAGKEITLAHLAEQNSGLPRLPDNLGNDADPYAKYTEGKLYDFLAKHELRRAPGAEYEYSNLAVGLLGHCLARRTGQSYEDIISARILDPLGMGSTFVQTPEADRHRVAQGYGVVLDLLGVRIHSEEAPWTWDVLAGAGGLRSTLPDMMKFLAAAMGGDTPLKPAFELAEAERFPFAPNNSTGLNWHRSTDPATGQTLVWHNGGTGGYHSFLGFKNGVGVVLLANTSADEVDGAATGIIDGIAKLTPTP